MAELVCLGFTDIIPIRERLLELRYRAMHIEGEEISLQVFSLSKGSEVFPIRRRNSTSLNQTNDQLIAFVRAVLKSVLDEFEYGEVLEPLILVEFIKEVPRIRSRMQELIQIAEAKLAE